MSNEAKNESIRIDGSVLDRIRNYVNATKPKITATSFISLEMDKVMTRIEKRKSNKK